MKIVHVARFGRWVAVVHERSNGTFVTTPHCSNFQIESDCKDWSVDFADQWVRSKHIQDLEKNNARPTENSG